MFCKRQVFAVFAVLAASCTLTACASTEEAGSGGGDGEKNADCGTKATSDCTPRVGPKGKVRVDALIWSVTGAKAVKQLGDMQYGLGEKADGRFVVVDLKVRSDKDESATITSEAVQLDVGGNTYDVDLDGTVAAIGDGQDPLFLEDIGPDATVKSKVVFDVPARALKQKPAIRFNELGFGDAHAFIELPKLGG